MGISAAGAALSESFPVKLIEKTETSLEDLAAVRETNLFNQDLGPIRSVDRTWTQWNIAALWIAMSVSIPTYTLASGLMARGMNWKQAIATVFLGNLIVLIPMTLNACPGTAYGIPFPVLLRSSFGVWGANVPAIMRGLVACGWFGIQTWIGGSAIYIVAALLLGFDPAEKVILPFLGISAGQLTCFLIFWVMNIAVILKGMECIKWLENLSAPFLLAIGLGLLVWAYQVADGFGPLLEMEDKFATRGEFFDAFAAGLTAMVGFWATLSLNIPDFSRFARSQRDQIIGQTLGLPLTMAFYSGIGAIVTSATVVVYGEAIWNPVELMARFDNTGLVIFGLITLTVATLSTNIAANIVSPANDFSNLWPRRISFRKGALIAGGIGLCIFPWKILENADRYIDGWMIGYSALLGPIGGIMIADYFVHRRQRIKVIELYKPMGEYRYTAGFSLTAFAALAIGIIPNVPGFLAKVNLAPVESIPSFFLGIYNFAWFIGFLVAFCAYLTGKALAGSARTGQNPD